jgi:hypothetical protein
MFETRPVIRVQLAFKHLEFPDINVGIGQDLLNKGLYVSRSEILTKWILGTLSTPRGRKVFLCFCCRSSTHAAAESNSS